MQDWPHTRTAALAGAETMNGTLIGPSRLLPSRPPTVSIFLFSLPYVILVFTNNTNHVPHKFTQNTFTRIPDTRMSSVGRPGFYRPLLLRRTRCQPHSLSATCRLVIFISRLKTFNFPQSNQQCSAFVTFTTNLRHDGLLFYIKFEIVHPKRYNMAQARCISRNDRATSNTIFKQKY